MKDARKHLSQEISDVASRKIIADFMRFVIDWNHQDPPHKVFSYVRENINIGFTPDLENNKERRFKPNFLVIRLPNTQTEIKQLHLDFDLGLQSSPPPETFQEYLTLRPSRADTQRPRWIVTRDALQTMGLEKLKQLFLVAYERRWSDLTKTKKKSRKGGPSV